LVVDASLVAHWNWVYDFLVSNKADLGLEDIFKGDQVKIARTPTACVEPGPKRRELVGAQRQTAVNNDLYIILYMGSIDNPEVNQEDGVILAEAIEAKLHEHARLNDLAIHSMVQEIEPGYATRSRTVQRAVRITFAVQAQELLPASAP
jgi:hypothetical protein